MTLFVKLCANEEGYWKIGSVPNRDNNPMDLRHSPHSSHPQDPNGIGVIDTRVNGFADAERQAKIWADRGLTLRQTIYILAPPNENNSEKYLQDVISGFDGRVTGDSLMTQVLQFTINNVNLT